MVSDSNENDQLRFLKDDATTVPLVAWGKRAADSHVLARWMWRWSLRPNRRPDDSGPAAVEGVEGSGEPRLAIRYRPSAAAR